jgi:hypothetical protein
MSEGPGRIRTSRRAAQEVFQVALRAARAASLRLAREAAAWAGHEDERAAEDPIAVAAPRSAAYRRPASPAPSPTTHAGVYFEPRTDEDLSGSPSTSLKLVARAPEPAPCAPPLRPADRKAAYRTAAREVRRVADAPAEAVAHGLDAAAALIHLDPPTLLRFLRTRRDGVGAVVRALGALPGRDWSPALGDLVKAAGRIRPTPREALLLFDAVAPEIGQNRHARAASARFFGANLAPLLRAYQTNRGDVAPEGQATLAVFFAQTLFTPPSFEGRAAYRLDLLLHLVELVHSLDARARHDPLSPARECTARLLGSLVGALERGFRIAAEARAEEAVEGMTVLVFRAAGLLPDVFVPRLGLLRRATFDGVGDWVGTMLAGRTGAAEGLALHAVVRELIPVRSLFVLYDEARRDASGSRASAGTPADFSRGLD